MSKLLYAVMYTVNADFTGAYYADNKVTLVGLTEAQIAESPRVKNRIDKLEISNDELSAMVSELITREPNEVMAILSIPQGKWLYANHPEFKPVSTEAV